MRRKTRKERINEWLSSPYMLLVYRLLATLMALSISRWMLYLFNIQFFHQLSMKEAISLYFSGMRFDLPIVFGINILTILFYCFPTKIIYNKRLQGIVDIVYVTLNSFAIFLNFFDIVSFHFFGKHLTIDFVRVLGHSDEISYGTLKQVFFDYWYLLVILILFILTIRVVAQQTRINPPAKEERPHWRLHQAISLGVMALLSLIAIHGGFQAKPISVETAMQYTDPQNAPILLNTPFCLFTTHETTLKERTGTYDSDYTPIHNDLTPNRFIQNDSIASDSVPSNVVVIIMKNIGQEMLGHYSHDRRFEITPFLDSLLSQSLTFFGMSNSRRGLEALPAIMASIPALMENDFTRSAYADNDFDAFCQHLQRNGYNTIFMHGGKNGILGFDEFSHRAGIRNYFGRIEYGDENDFDGQWGIFDGPFLQYVANTLNRVHEPFATMVYTLSSRYPYKVPRDFELPEESYFWSGFEKTVYYVDCALRDFFTTASQMPWFDRTLFVITADYPNSVHFQPEYSNVWGMYAIPIAFYYPQKISPIRCEEIAQQIDLGPSILSALGVNDTLFSFGRNLFDTISDPTFVSYYNLTYQYCDGNYLVQSDGERPFGIFKPLSDTLLNDNLIDRLQCTDVFDKLYKFLQEYNNRMISNNLKPSTDIFYEQAEDTIHH